MRSWWVLGLPLLMAGCYADVSGSLATEGCGTKADPMDSVIAVTPGILGFPPGVFPGGGSSPTAYASWAGRSFEALEDGVVLNVGGAGSAPMDSSWWGGDARAWALVALASGERTELLEARAGLSRYADDQTTIHVGGRGQSVGGDPVLTPQAAGLGPFQLKKGDVVLVAGASDTSVAAMALHMEWEGCGRTGKIAWGKASGVVVGWPQLQGPAVVEQASLGAVGVQAMYEAGAEDSIVVARPPPGDDVTGFNEAKITTSRGASDLTKVGFFLHDGGNVRYETTHVGDAGSDALLAIIPLPWEQVKMGGPSETA